MSKGLRIEIAVLAGLSLASIPASAGSYKSLAKKLSRQAAKAGVERLSVAPFKAMDGSDGAFGRHIAERLSTNLARYQGVRLVERSRMGSIMEEHYLGRTGALDQGSLSRVGALLQARAVVTGSYVSLGNTVEISARIVDIETGEVLGSRTAKVRRDWFSGLGGIIPEPAPISADEAIADVYEFQTGRKYRPKRRRPRQRRSTLLARRGGAAGDLRDSLNDDPCSGAAGRVDAMQEEILELKARYWAKQLGRRGFDAKRVARKPGTLITSHELKLEFLELLQEEAAAGPKPLSMGEVRRFIDVDRRSFELHAKCGL